MAIRIQQASEQFTQWSILLTLLQRAFDYQKSRINPPSSLNKMNVKSLEEQAQREILLLAYSDKLLAGCVLLRAQTDSLYVGKLAVLPEMQGQGIAKQLLHRAQKIGTELKCVKLELQVRIELVENQAAFAAMGFVKTAETSHPGFDSVTSITMQKTL